MAGVGWGKNGGDDGDEGVFQNGSGRVGEKFSGGLLFTSVVNPVDGSRGWAGMRQNWFHTVFPGLSTGRGAFHKHYVDNE